MNTTGSEASLTTDPAGRRRDIRANLYSSSSPSARGQGLLRNYWQEDWGQEDWKQEDWKQEDWKQEDFVQRRVFMLHQFFCQS